jgi:hypothetical protein
MRERTRVGMGMECGDSFAEVVKQFLRCRRVFAFGLIAYEMLVGRAAFGESPVATQLRSAEIILPSCESLDPIVARCLVTRSDASPARRRADRSVRRRAFPERELGLSRSPSTSSHNSDCDG